MNSKARRGPAATLGLRRKGTWFCELAVVALLLSSQGTMPTARAEELPPAAAEDCGGEDEPDPRAENCDRAHDTPPACDESEESEHGTGETDETAIAPTRAGDDEDADDSDDRPENQAPNGDERRPAGAAEEAGSCARPADTAPAGRAGEGGEGDEGGTTDEPAPKDELKGKPAREPKEEPAREPEDEPQELPEPEPGNESGERPPREPAGDEATAEKNSPAAAPVVPDDTGARDPDTGLPALYPAADCPSRHVLLDCSAGPHVPNAGASDEGDPPAVERRPAPSRGPERPEPLAEQMPTGMNDPLAPVPVSWRPGGALNTDALTAALNDDGEVTPEDYAPFIIAGRASWMDTWGAPRFGPGAAIRQHEGQDVFCDHGAPVLAAQEGIIEFDAGGLGGRVARVYRPDGAYWYYAHLSLWNTARFDSGDSVAPGDVIGYCGNTGNASTTPPHVHFGLYGPDGRATDPMPWLVRWLRAAERAAGLRQLSAAPDPVELDLQALVPDRDVAATPAPRPLRTAGIERFDTAGDTPRSLRRAGINHVFETWTPTRPSAGDQALEFVGIGALLAAIYMMRVRWNGDRLEASHRTHRDLPEGDPSGR